MQNERESTKRYSVSYVTQGEHRFYTLTIPSDVLTQCCFVSTRFDDPREGFQRLLDKNRAQDIANYIDTGLGTIPCSIILSAQPEAKLKIIGKGKTLQFCIHPKAFLIIDGQHRVFGFSLAKSSLRVPVVIYNKLSRRNETRLFIDINSKQKGVPNELLLDIKRLAEYESDVETQLRDVYDLFMNDRGSILFGKCAPSSREKDMISRVTFNNAMKPLLRVFGSRPTEEVYDLLNAYLRAFHSGLREMGVEECLTSSVVFRAVSAFFPDIASKVKDRFGADYDEDRFYEVLSPMFSRVKASRIRRPGTSYKALVDHFGDCLKTEFSL